MLKKIGKQSVKLVKNISIIATSSIVGPKEGKGPLSSFFDIVLDDSLMGAPSWEQGESRIVEKSLNLAISKSNLSSQNIDYVFSGDLLDQSIGLLLGLKT